MAFIAIQCKQKEVKREFSFTKKEAKEQFKASETIDLENKGVAQDQVNSLILFEYL